MPVNSLIRIRVAYADDNFKPVLLNQERFLNKTNMKKKKTPVKKTVHLITVKHYPLQRSDNYTRKSQMKTLNIFISYLLNTKGA